jgi:hypothetical protein
VLDEELAQFGVVDEGPGRASRDHVLLRFLAQSLWTGSGWLAWIGCGANRGSPWVTYAQVKADASCVLRSSRIGLTGPGTGVRRVASCCHVPGSRHHSRMAWRRC